MYLNSEVWYIIIFLPIIFLPMTGRPEAWIVDLFALATISVTQQATTAGPMCTLISHPRLWRYPLSVTCKIVNGSDHSLSSAWPSCCCWIGIRVVAIYGRGGFMHVIGTTLDAESTTEIVLYWPLLRWYRTNTFIMHGGQDRSGDQHNCLRHGQVRP